MRTWPYLARHRHTLQATRPEAAPIVNGHARQRVRLSAMTPRWTHRLFRCNPSARPLLLPPTRQCQPTATQMASTSQHRHHRRNPRPPMVKRWQPAMVCMLPQQAPHHRVLSTPRQVSRRTQSWTAAASQRPTLQLELVAGRVRCAGQKSCVAAAGRVAGERTHTRLSLCWRCCARSSPLTR